MVAESSVIYLFAFLLSTLATKVDLNKIHKDHINKTITDEKGSGSGLPGAPKNDATSANKTRKDYIIAIEDNSPMDEAVDPVFQSLRKLAKRTRGKMAVMDYGTNDRGFHSPFGSKLGYRNEIANDDNDYDDDDYGDDDGYNEGYNDEFGARMGGKQGLIGPNVIKNLLGLRFAMEEERGKQNDEVQGPDEMNYDERSSNYPPAVVYELGGNKLNNDGDYADDEVDDDAYSRSREPMFLFGDDKK